MARVHSAKKAAVASSSKQNAAEKPIKEKPSKKKKDPTSKGKEPAKSSEGADKFKEDVLALGGDDEDYELLKGVSSETEERVQGSSKQDVSKFS